jgi:hypothetical protein
MPKPDAKARPNRSQTGSIRRPLGDLAKAKSARNSSAEPFIFFVQLGAYRTVEDAETQRAKLSLSGIETKITEREQSGGWYFGCEQGLLTARKRLSATRKSWKRPDWKHPWCGCNVKLHATAGLQGR